jgi:hypothetical protein
MIGTLPVWNLAPREYGQALDAAMALLAGEETPVLRCEVSSLAAEARQRLPAWRETGPAGTALWIEPLEDDWQAALDALCAGLNGGGTMVIVTSRPLARLLPERRGWPGKALGLQRGGLGRLRRALAEAGLALETEYGLHSLPATLLNVLGQMASRWNRPDLGDRLHFAGRLRYVASGPLARLSTVALLVARADKAGSSRRSCQVRSSASLPGGEQADPTSTIDETVACLDDWLETMRGPGGTGGYGGPVAHWWRQGLLYAGPALDWRYEGIIGGYLALWERTGDEHWLTKARRAGDDLLVGQSPAGHYAASAFELNPATAGTPHEAACGAALLLLSRGLRAAGEAGWEAYAAAAERNLEAFYVDRLWDPEVRAFRDSPGGPSFVPNKAATACEAFFLLAEVRGEDRWAEQYALPTLDRILGYQVNDGAIAQNSIGDKRIEKYFPFYIARCVPALLRGYEWSGDERYVDAALAALRFIARWAADDGSLPAVVYPGGRANHYPAWIAALGDVLRAAGLAHPYGFDHDLSATRERLLAGQDTSGGFQTATGFAAQAGGRPPALPDLRDLLHVAGWCGMAFRYLAPLVGPALAPVQETSPFEADCTFRGQTMHVRETPDELVVSAGEHVHYYWRKGDPWPRVAKPEFWLQ